MAFYRWLITVNAPPRNRQLYLEIRGSMTAYFLMIAISLCCGIGLWVSAVMLRRTRLAERGLLDEPSVVERPDARLFLGIPNALVGIVAYLAIAGTTWVPSLGYVSIAISAIALLVSMYLGYKLLTAKLSCRNCWTAHVINALIFVLLLVRT